MDGWVQAMMLAALVAGLLGGPHCAAMCGGIVGMTCSPRAGGASPSPWLPLAYNTGRLTSYAVAGALAGALGQAGVALRGGAPTQHLLMFLMGVTLIVVALNVAGVRTVARGMEAAGGFLWRQVQPLAGRFLPVKSPWHALGLGALWGWLPCGMVYGMLLTAMASGSAVEGALILAAFGAGTLPNLLAISLAAGSSWHWMRHHMFRYAASALIAATGVYGMLHALQLLALQSDSLFCRFVPGVADILR